MAAAASVAPADPRSASRRIVGSHDLIARTFGCAAGLDYHVTRDTVAGVALAGGGTNWSLAQGIGSGRSDAFQAGIYAATRSGPAYLAASLAFANHWMSTDRYAAFGNHLTADFKAQSFGGRIEGGYRFGTPIVGITPYAAIQAQSFRTPGYSEIDTNGGGFGLSYNSRSGTDTRSELGARFDHVAAFDRNAVLTLRARLAWSKSRPSKCECRGRRQARSASLSCWRIHCLRIHAPRSGAPSSNTFNSSRQTTGQRWHRVASPCGACRRDSLMP
jgi:uncharacterized protein YhjY with autotransporter beta-barrel domain